MLLINGKVNFNPQSLEYKRELARASGTRFEKMGINFVRERKIYTHTHTHTHVEFLLPVRRNGNGGETISAER